MPVVGRWANKSPPAARRATRRLGGHKNQLVEARNTTGRSAHLGDETSTRGPCHLPEPPGPGTRLPAVHRGRWNELSWAIFGKMPFTIGRVGAASRRARARTCRASPGSRRQWPFRAVPAARVTTPKPHVARGCDIVSQPGQSRGKPGVLRGWRGGN